MSKTTVTVALVGLASAVLSPGDCVAQQSQAMRMLGKFAVSMLSGVAADY